MFKLMPDVPENVVAVSAVGEVTGEDYENVLIPAVEAVLKENEKVRALCYFGPDFSGYKAAALWDDARIGMRHFTSWERIAVVTDVEWIARSVKAFGFMMPGEVRVFNNDQLTEALTWVEE